MKINMPVTSNEIELRDTSSIVSKTDLKGIITYVNQDFINISGFSREDVLGVNHNVVRHPDMPPAAFQDLWDTVKTGKSWNGIVKNRCKNGDFYWVSANVTPLRENGAVVGYISVRSKASREQITAADSLYRKMRDGKKSLPGLKEGITMLKNLTIRTRILTLILITAAALAVGAWVGLDGMKSAAEGLKTVYEDRMVCALQLSDIRKLQADIQDQMTLALLHDPKSDSAKFNDHPVSKHTDKIQADIAESDKIWKDYTSTYLTPDEKALVDQFAPKREQYLAQAVRPLINLINAGRYADANVLLNKTATAQYADAEGSLDKLLQLQADVAKQEYDKAETNYTKTRNLVLISVPLTLLLTSFLGWLLYMAVVPTLRRLSTQIEHVAQGDASTKIEPERNDEIADVILAYKALHTRLEFDKTEAQRVADESLRVKIALDNVATNVMIADNDLNIIYLNKSVNAMLQNAEADLRKALPNFTASKLLGANIDQFHKNPAHQRSMLATFNSNYKTQINVGGRTFALSANPVINSQGERLGSVVEWNDRTLEVAVENEVAQIVEAASLGDLTKRINIAGKEGFFLSLSEGINQMVSAAEGVINETVNALERISGGDMTQRIQGDYEGSYGIIKDNANLTVERLTEIVSNIKAAADSINTAAKEIAAGNTDLSQRTEEQASSLEETASSMEELASTVKQNAENAKQANQMAAAASSVAVKGGAVVGEVVNTMTAINDSSRKIVDIISVIDGIAFQTNILALNAAVEAARAGEQGRGFAVVAGEVRNLAQRSAAAAKEIKQLISDSVEKVEGGSKLVEQAGATMEEIVTSVKRVTDIMAEITAASVEQSSGIDQVNQAVTQMDEVTQQNAALVEEAAAAAESLEEQSQTLIEAVSIFKLPGSGSSSSRTSSSRSIASSSTSAAKPSRKALPPRALSKGDDGDWEEF